MKKPEPIVRAEIRMILLDAKVPPMEAMLLAATSGAPAGPLPPDLAKLTASEAYRGAEKLGAQREGQRKGVETRRADRDERRGDWLIRSKKLHEDGVVFRTDRAKRIQKSLDDGTPEAPSVRAIYDYLSAHEKDGK